MRTAVLIPLFLFTYGCDWEVTTTSDGFTIGPDKRHPADIRVNNRTDQPVIIRYLGASGVDHRVSIPVGGHRSFEAWPRNDAIKADYRHVIHWYDIPDECDVVIDVQAEDFVPASPVANG